jgi:hypothetical protein
VFASLYGHDGEVLTQPTSLPPAETLAAWGATLSQDARVRFSGDGAVKYADVIRAQLGDRAVLPSDVPLLAGSIARIAAAHPDRAVLPHAVVPLYVRRSDAELARDRQATRR